MIIVPSNSFDVGPVEGNTSNGATLAGDPVFSFPVVTAFDIVDGVVPVDCGPNDDDTLYPLGATTETCTAVDASTNSVSDSFDVTVVDTTDPDLSIPDDITAHEANVLGGADDVDIGIATATDIVDTSVDITDNAPAFFPLGTTPVTWTATDDSGNAQTANMN